MKSIKNTAEFETILNGDKPVVLDFYAEWCSTCKALLPALEVVSTDHENEVVFAKVNIEENPDLAAKYGVRSIPNVFFVKNNAIVDQFTGVQNKTFIDEKVKNLLAH